MLNEPLTAYTDYALAAASLGFAVATRRVIGPHNRVSGGFWCAAFVAAGISAAAGGTFHGFDVKLEPATLRRLWNLTMFSMGACGALIAAGVHAADVKRAGRAVGWLACGIAITLVGAAVQQGLLPAGALGANPAFHLIQIIAFYFCFRCARLVRDRSRIARQ